MSYQRIGLVKPLFNDTEIRLYRDTYETGGLAVIAICPADDPEDGWEDYGIVTVNLGQSPSETFAYVDTNNLRGIDQWLFDNGFAVPTGHVGPSGFCTYPRMKFYVDRIPTADELARELGLESE